MILPRLDEWYNKGNRNLRRDQNTTDKNDTQKKSVRFRKGTNLWDVLLNWQFEKKEEPFVCSHYVVSKNPAEYFILLRLIKESEQKC